MEIKRIKEESYESIRGYLDVIMPYLNELGKPVFIDMEKGRYFVTQNGDSFYIVENDNKNLTPYIVLYDEDELKGYSTEEYEYEFNKDESGITSYKRVNILSGNIDHMMNFEEANKVAFYQQHVNEGRTCIYAYDFKSDASNDWKLLNLRDRRPSKISLQELVGLNILPFKKERCYFLRKDYRTYYGCILRKKDLFVPNPFSIYEYEEVLNHIASCGFYRSVPTTLINQAMDKDDEVKQLKLITSAYQNYNSSQK